MSKISSVNLMTIENDSKLIKEESIMSDCDCLGECNDFKDWDKRTFTKKDMIEIMKHGHNYFKKYLYNHPEQCYQDFIKQKEDGKETK